MEEKEKGQKKEKKKKKNPRKTKSQKLSNKGPTKKTVFEFFGQKNHNFFYDLGV